MTLHIAIRDHLATSGLSMQALSLKAGLSPKTVANILNRPGRRPGRKIIEALNTVIGTELPDHGPRATYAALIANLSKKTGDQAVDARNATLVSRLRIVLRAAGWVPELEDVDKGRMLDCFANWSPASLGVSRGSFATYKADVLSAIDIGCGANRKADIRDVSGLYREIHEAVKQSKLKKDLKLASGSFFSYLHHQGISPSDITEGILSDYFRHRISDTSKTEADCRKHVKRIAALCTRLSSDPAFSCFQFPEVSHPFDDGRDKYGVSDTVLADFLQEFDGPVTRWATGAESRDGLSYAAFLAQLDAQEPVRATDDKKALLKPRRNGRKTTEEERRSAGFLLADETWSMRTLHNRRGILVAGAKALYAATGYRIESVAEYTDPDVVESVLESVQAGNSDGEFPSSYAATVGKTLKKLARDYVGRDEQDISAIASMIKDHVSGKKGIAERNKAKLRQIVGRCQQQVIDLSEILINEVNDELDRLARKRRGVQRVDLIDAEVARDIMCAVANDMLLARAPRKENIIGAKLSWISHQGDLATIRVPNVEVKMRTADDPDLVIPLGRNESRRLRLYLEKVRPKALQDGDDANPFLFPAQGQTAKKHQPYSGLLERLMRHTKRIVGIRMNPHLYRHFVGWIWLKEDPDRLPDVQRLLGHKSLETTLRYYAEIDENLALDRWQTFLTDKKSPQPKGFKKMKGLK